MDEKIQELRTPEKIITDSRVNDAKKALALWDDFYKRNEMDVDDAYFEKAASIYNALFYALTVHKDEWLALQERISEQVEELKKLHEEK